MKFQLVPESKMQGDALRVTLASGKTWRVTQRAASITSAVLAVLAVLAFFAMGGPR